MSNTDAVREVGKYSHVDSALDGTARHAADADAVSKKSETEKEKGIVRWNV